MGARSHRYLGAILLAFALIFASIGSCRSLDNPHPEPAPVLSPSVVESPGAGNLTTITVPVPNTIGPSTVWTPAALISTSSAQPSAAVAGDIISIWGSTTGTEPFANQGVFLGRMTISAGTAVFAPLASTWAGWPFVSPSR
jgi:hypothetical protein